MLTRDLNMFFVKMYDITLKMVILAEINYR